MDVSQITWLQDVFYLVNDWWRAWALNQTLVNQACQNKHDMAILHQASCPRPSIKIDARKIFITFKLLLLCMVTKSRFGHHRINNKKRKWLRQLSITIVATKKFWLPTFGCHSWWPIIFYLPEKNWELPEMLHRQWLTTTRYSLMCMWDYLGMWIIIMLWKILGCTNVQCKGDDLYGCWFIRWIALLIVRR